MSPAVRPEGGRGTAGLTAAMVAKALRVSPDSRISPGVNILWGNTLQASALARTLGAGALCFSNHFTQV